MRLRVRSLAVLSGIRIWRCRELWYRSDPELLWLWHRPAATAPVRPLAWELPYAAGSSPRKGKKKKEKEKKKKFRTYHTAGVAKKQNKQKKEIQNLSYG